MRSAGPWWTTVEVISWLSAAAVGLVAITQALEWPDTGTVAIVQALTPYLGIVLAPVAAISLWRRWWLLATTAAAIGAGLLWLSAPVVLPADQPEADPTASGTTIAAVNLLYTNENVADVADALEGVLPDVLVMSEYTEAHQATFEQHPLVGKYPYRLERPGGGADGIAIWSQQPFVEAERLDTKAASLIVNVTGPDGDLRVVGIHPSTPVYDVERWRGALGVLAEIGRSADGPTAVVGDLNATYWHPEFRTLLDVGFVDAHIADGRGFAASWPTDWVVPPFVQLDHALTIGGLVSTDVVDLEVPGSDHRGLVVTVVPTR